MWRNLCTLPLSGIDQNLKFTIFFYCLLFYYCDWYDINDINIKKDNTDSCFDSNGTQEFNCNCKDGFDGTRCEEECDLKCENNGICRPDVKPENNSVATKIWKCDCQPGFEGEHIKLKALYQI